MILRLSKLRKVTVILILVFNLIASLLSAQTEKATRPSNFALSVYGGTGFTKQISHQKNSSASIQPSFLYGIQWKANHLLCVGIESGYVTIENKTEEKVSTDFGTTSFHSRLSAVPYIPVYLMKIKRIDISGGMGISHVTSAMEAFNTQIKTSRWFYTYYAAIGYSYSVKRLNFSARANLYSFAKMNTTIAGASIIISYDFIKW